MADVPDEFVTVTATVPEPLGLMAVSSVLETNVGATRVVPKETVLSLVKLLPAIVTCVPPAAGPTIGAIEATLGVAAWASAGHAPTNRTANALASTSTAARPSRRVETFRAHADHALGGSRTLLSFGLQHPCCNEPGT